MTGAGDVHALLDALTAAGIRWWVSGGWGVDALIGRQTRDHRDLDLLIPIDRSLAALELLRGMGFALTTDWFPVRFEMTDDRGRAVDLHPVTIEADGSALQSLPDGSTWRFSAEGLTATGTIAGRGVAVISAAEQLRAHTGYDPTPTDQADVALLVEHFGLEAPPGYG